jgi:ankyrin repeat protein
VGATGSLGEMLQAGWTSLFIASREGHLETVKALIEGRASLEARNNVSRKRARAYADSRAHGGWVSWSRRRLSVALLKTKVETGGRRGGRGGRGGSGLYTKTQIVPTGKES